MATASSGSWFKPQYLGGVLLVGGRCARTPSGTLEQGTETPNGPPSWVRLQQPPCDPPKGQSGQGKERKEESKSTLSKLRSRGCLVFNNVMNYTISDS